MEFEPGFQLYLVGAIVDSVQYGIVTSVKQTEKETPNYFLIFQNFPNPFNPSTTIMFKSPEGKQVSIIIYNVLGELIRALYNDIGSGVTQKILWDGKNDNGLRVNAGVYFYQIRTEGFSAAKKMLLVQ